MVDYNLPFVFEPKAIPLVPRQTPHIPPIPPNAPKPILKTELIHDSFPPQGEEHKAHEGSQSESPSKDNA